MEQGGFSYFCWEGLRFFLGGGLFASALVVGLVVTESTILDCSLFKKTPMSFAFYFLFASMVKIF